MKRYVIYQLPVHDKHCFLDLEMNKTPDLLDYVRTYKGITLGNQEDDKKLCEELFQIFNNNHPEHFAARSMSVSDIIQIENKYYYCDSIGFVELKELEGKGLQLV